MKKALNKINNFILNNYNKDIQFRHTCMMLVETDCGAFTYEIDCRHKEIELDRLQEVIADCTIDPSSIKVSHLMMDYNL